MSHKEKPFAAIESGHSSRHVREARQVQNGQAFKKLVKEREPRRYTPPPDCENKLANPTRVYLVNGCKIKGKKFPGGILPLNATLYIEENK